VLGAGFARLELTARLSEEFEDGIEIVLLDCSPRACSASQSST
jgi:hypothetical protein